MPDKILISDHMFLYNICSACKYGKNKVSHDPIVQIWFFHVIAGFTPFTVRNTPFMGKIFILDHMFQYDICSACQYEKNDVSHDPVVQIWFFSCNSIIHPIYGTKSQQTQLRLTYVIRTYWLTYFLRNFHYVPET